MVGEWSEGGLDHGCGRGYEGVFMGFTKGFLVISQRVCVDFTKCFS